MSRCRRAFLQTLCAIAFACSLFPGGLAAQQAWIRVNQIGYEDAESTTRAYLMTTAPVSGATFRVLEKSGATAYTGTAGRLMSTWASSPTLVYNIYPLDFHVPRGESYTIQVSGPVTATSPHFAVERPDALYPGLLLNSLFYYQTSRDGPDYIANALRNAPGHLKDEHASRFVAPPIDDNGNIDNPPPSPPLVPSGLPPIDATGGWWDAGDYMKYLITTSYTVGLMETGIRDFPFQMGPLAPSHTPRPPNAVSWAGESGRAAPQRPDFTAEARYGIDFLLKLWDSRTKTLSFQVDNSQEWNDYGQGDPASTGGYCGGTYDSPYCLITEYDIWTLPQAADNYQQAGDPEPCDPYTTFFICNRPVYLSGPPGATIEPNLAGRLAAAFGLCYQLAQVADPKLANRCLRAGEDIFALANLHHSEPVTYPDVLVTSVPTYPEQAWSDDLEWGATELALAVGAGNLLHDLPSGLPVTDPAVYLRDASHYARRYVDRIYTPGFGDTLNAYDVSTLAHFDLFFALELAGNPAGLELSGPAVRKQLLRQVDNAISTADATAFDFGNDWDNGDITSHGAGLSVIASEAYAISGDSKYQTYARRWMADILGANAWGASFIVGDGSIFPNCIQHQVANLAGALNGRAGGTPILWGASTEGPNTTPSSGLVSGMRTCPADGVDGFAQFNGNTGAFNPNDYVLFQDDVQSYTTTEPTLDLTATSFLMWSWRLAEAGR